VLRQEVDLLLEAAEREMQRAVPGGSVVIRDDVVIAEYDTTPASPTQEAVGAEGD
jgi:hypothetical protein